jgi:eukaryotic-like serine/threonine-protein kinase
MRRHSDPALQSAAAAEVLSTGTRERAQPQASPTASGMRRAVGFGKYRLFARIGSGGMADVYLSVAESALNVNRLVVIKRLRDEHVNDPSIREMFLDEARLAARLAHPNVIQTYEAGNEEGNFFLAMEYVDGQPLSRILTSLKRSGRILEPRVAARICSDALAGLHYAHEYVDFDGTPLEIVHRDVSPQNIMLTYEGTVKLVDFGIAKAVGTTETAHGVFKGKIAFMAPEQVRSSSVDRRADLFAAGIVLWESLTGKLLMADSTPAKTLYNVMTKPIPAPSEINPAVPAALDAICLRALQRSADDRYATAKEMRDELEAFIATCGGVTKDELGELTSGLFTETRDKVQAQIKSQLATLALGRSGQTAHSMTETQIRSMNSVLVDLEDGFVPSERSTQGSLLQAIITEAGPKSGSRPLSVLAWFGIPVLALLIGGLTLLRLGPALTRGSDPTSTASAPPAAVVIVTATAASPSAAPPEGAITTTTASPPPTGTPPPTARPNAGLPAAPPRPPPPVFTPIAPRPSAPPATAAAAVAPAKSADPPTGRTFRREL